MARQAINHGTTANDGTGEGLFTAYQKINSMTLELYGNVVDFTASHTATDGNWGRTLVFNSATAVTLTIPATVPLNWGVTIIQLGAGQVTVSVGAGGALLARSGHNKTAGQYATAAVKCIANAGSAAQIILTGDTA